MVKEFLEHDHQSLSVLLDKLDGSFELSDPAQAYELLDLFWARLATHIRAENLCLFPAILNADPELFHQRGLSSIDQVRVAIARLREDHNFFMDELAEAVKIMREVVSQPEANGTRLLIDQARHKIAAVKQRLVEHNTVEEEQVYQWPAALLSPQEVARLTAEVRRQAETLPHRFASNSNGKTCQ
jgi:hemerythrin superfamily protein